MKTDSSLHAIALLGHSFDGFVFQKSKRCWILNTSSGVSLIISFQPSRHGDIFYLNFGVYFHGLDNSKNVKIPKASEWHLTARFESFERMSNADYNQMFVIDESASHYGCIRDIVYCKILPRLKIFLDYREVSKAIATKGSKAFEPFWVQNVSTNHLIEFIGTMSER